MDYKKAGVDIEAGYKSVELMKEHVKGTMREEVLGGLGGFSGAFSLAKIKEMEEPVLLSGTDGCGTKVKLAIIMDKHDTIGIDAVAMCVNDIACAGGEPLFFLDYIACGKNYPEKIADIVKGVAEGCLQSEAALIGGETAEHPGLMPEEDYDPVSYTHLEQTYIEAMRCLGAKKSRIMWKHMAPNILSPIIVQVTFVFASSIITEAALSFLGAGVPAPAPSWGNILNEGKSVIYNAWWMVVFPGIFTAVTVLGLNLLGDGIRDFIDPMSN